MQPFRNYYPSSYGYNPYFAQYQQPVQQAQTAQPTQNDIKWVQGEAGAKAYVLGSGQSVLLMDSECNSFYIKSTDASGMPLPLRIFDYTERIGQSASTAAPQSTIDTSLFVTKAELEERLTTIFNNSSAEATASQTKKETVSK